MVELDLSKPLATLLREGTRPAHDKVSVRAQRMLKGELSKEDYALYLMMLWHVYDALDKALDQHATHPILEPIYNPTLLARTASLSADISYYLQVDDWQNHSLHQNLLASFEERQQLTTYIARINALASQEDPSGLLGHAYVRYLGDLSGGQNVRHALAKAYGLDEAADFGISFYAFKELKSSNRANMGEMKRIKEWFRAGMNVAGDRGDQKLKASLVEEALLAFDLSYGLFDLLYESILQTANFTTIKTSKSLQNVTFPLSQVVAVIAAVCLAHFILVVGGFTGNAGYQKWVAFQNWLDNFWQSNTP